MGSLCSNGRCGKGDDAKTKETVKSSVAVSVREESVVEKGFKGDESVRPSSKTQSGSLVVPITSDKGENNKTFIVERPKSGHHQRRATLDMGGVNVFNPPVSRGTSIVRSVEGDSVVSGWPSWLTSVAGEAIQGWVPRRADSFEKLGKIGQGTYSSVYKARDLETGKIVAMKKVRFVNMDPESVRFMAREIHILRKLDHPNVMKLEGLVTSRMSGSLYLVFEYMEHDLAGLAANPNVRFSEPQIKCYMQQLLLGLEHCHSRGVLHRDIKGSNLLIDNNGVLKIGDFGLATFFKPEQKQPLTSRVVTLWYRAPELLLGATEYGVGVDLWSTGCILAELFAGKPIMPGRTEVEQMHKILKLCGSPSEDYWRKSKFPHATSFKPHHAYRRCIAETFKDFPPPSLALINVLLSMTPEERVSATSALHSEFFTTMPLPCAPSALPKYPASKELDAKLREEETRRRKAEAKGRGAESVRGDANVKVEHTHGQSVYQGQSMIHKFIPHEDSLEPQRTTTHSSYSMVHPSAQGSLANRRRKEEGSTGRSFVASNNKPELRKQRSQASRDAEALNPHLRKGDALSTKESSTGYVPKKNRIHYSGPLVPPGGNLEDMLKEHERQIQQAVRKARARADRNNE